MTTVHPQASILLSTVAGFRFPEALPLISFPSLHPAAIKYGTVIGGGPCLGPEGGTVADEQPAVLATAACLTNVFAQPLVLRGTVQHKASGLCLRAAGGASSPADGTLLVFSATCDQAFHTTATGAMVHTSSGKCLQPTGGSNNPAEATRVVLGASCSHAFQFSYGPFCNCPTTPGASTVALLHSASAPYYDQACNAAGTQAQCELFLFTGQRKFSASSCAAGEAGPMCYAEISKGGTVYWIKDHACNAATSTMGDPRNSVCAGEPRGHPPSQGPHAAIPYQLSSCNAGACDCTTAASGGQRLLHSADAPLYSGATACASAPQGTQPKCEAFTWTGLKRTSECLGEARACYWQVNKGGSTYWVQSHTCANTAAKKIAELGDLRCFGKMRTLQRARKCTPTFPSLRPQVFRFAPACSHLLLAGWQHLLCALFRYWQPPHMRGVPGPAVHGRQRHSSNVRRPAPRGRRSGRQLQPIHCQRRRAASAPLYAQCCARA